ncbi:DUF6125 family protein [Chloroflexota bacterium]
MAELNDYSGEFNPKAKYQDFSKEALADLLTEYARLGLALDLRWYAVIRERHSEQEAIECERAVAVKKIPHRQQRIMEALHIQGNDIANCLKAIQMDIGACPNICDVGWELKNPNYGIYTINHCAALGSYERHGEVVTMDNICHTCSSDLNRVAKFFNPQITVKPLKLPPRKSEGEICCIWEFKIEE